MTPKPLQEGDDHNLLSNRSIGDPHPQYGLRSELGLLSGTKVPYGILYWNGTAWAPTGELLVDPDTHLVTITNNWLVGGDGEFTGAVGIHGINDIEKFSVRKIGPGALVFGIDTTSARIHLLGSQIVKRTAVASSPYNVAADDFLIAVDTNAARTINLPAAIDAEGRVLIVKDAVGTGANTNNITIAPSGGDSINQVAASITITVDRDLRRLCSNGTGNWDLL